MERVLYEVKKTVVGQDHFLERVLVAMLAGGHLLVEGVPGLAKTLTVKTLASTVRGSFRRCSSRTLPCSARWNSSIITGTLKMLAVANRSSAW